MQRRNKLLTIIIAFVITVFTFIPASHAVLITITDTYDPTDIYIGFDSEPLWWTHDMTSQGYDPSVDTLVYAGIAITFRDDEGDGLHTGVYQIHNTCTARELTHWRHGHGTDCDGTHPELRYDGPWLEYAGVYLDVNTATNQASVWDPALEINTGNAGYALPPTDPFGYHSGVFTNVIGSVTPRLSVINSDAWATILALYGDPPIYPDLELLHGGPWGLDGSNNDFYFERAALTLTYRHPDLATDPLTPTRDTVPEPTTVALLGIGLAGLAGVSARRKWKKKAVDNS